MRLLADENAPVPSIRLLRTAGYAVEAMIEIGPGSSDPEVLSYARRQEPILIPSTATSASGSTTAAARSLQASSISV